MMQRRWMTSLGGIVLCLVTACAWSDETRVVAKRATKTHDARLAPELSEVHQNGGEFLGLTRDNRAVLKGSGAAIAGGAQINLARDRKKVSLLVGYKGNKPATKTLKAAGVSQRRDNARHRFLKVDFDDSLTANEIQELLNDPAVKYVEPDYIQTLPPLEVPKVQPAAAPAAQPVATATPAAQSQNVVLRNPNDGYFPLLWGMTNIRAPNAWNKITSAANIIVGVIDTGVDYNHPDLAANMWHSPSGKVGYDFYDYDDDPLDEHFHGTHCAGTIAAVGNNGVGVAGVAWQCQIMALRFLGPEGGGFTSDAISCIDFGVANGAHILSNSWGGGPYSNALDNAIANAYTAGVLFTAAAGNSNLNNNTFAHYPSNYAQDNVVAVAAINSSNARASFSNFGSTTVDIGAPGVGIYSTFPTFLTDAMLSDGLPTSYASISGTSMATPHVSGAMALCWAQKYASPAQSISQMEDVRDTVLDNARQVAAHSSLWGNGFPASVPGGVLDIGFLGNEGGIVEKTYTGTVAWYRFLPSFMSGNNPFSVTFDPGGTTSSSEITSWTQTNYGSFATVNATVQNYPGVPGTIACSGYAYGNTLFLFGSNSFGLLIWNGTTLTPLSTTTTNK